jgi:MFS transporter, OPA family, glycerol-3-phosphate transporter
LTTSDARRSMRGTMANASVAIPAQFSQPAFRSRRVQNWMLLGLLYAFFYMTRYNFPAVNAHVADQFGWTNTELGVFASVMSLVYGLSVFLNGPLADRIGGKKAFLIGSAGVIVMSALFGAGMQMLISPAVWEGTDKARHVVQPAVFAGGMTSHSVRTILVTMWGINGYFQSFGALAIVKVNAQWFHTRERGSFSGVFGVLIRFGLILAFSGAPLIYGAMGLSWAFWLPAVCVTILFVLNWRFVQNAPAEAGYPGLDTGDEAGPDDGKPVQLVEVLKKVFASRAPYIIALGSMMIGFVRRSVVDDWYPKYFANTFSVSKGALGSFLPYQSAAWGIALLGIAGGFAFGISSDRVYHGRRAPVIVFGFLGMAVMLSLFGVVHRLQLGPWSAAACLMLLSFFVNGAHGMIGGAASMDFGGRKAAATAAGLFDGMQYLAGAFVGTGVGIVLDRWGWGAWMWAPIPFALVGAAVMATLWNVTPRGRAAH